MRQKSRKLKLKKESLKMLGDRQLAVAKGADVRSGNSDLDTCDTCNDSCLFLSLETSLDYVCI